MLTPLGVVTQTSMSPGRDQVDEKRNWPLPTQTPDTHAWWTPHWIPQAPQLSTSASGWTQPVSQRRPEQAGSHDWPSPTKPALHVQVKAPTVLAHVAR
jgi:hypothetical protein